MFTVVLIFLAFICFLLILVVLVQNSKGGGMVAGFGSGSANLMGVKRTGDLLENITWGLAITLIIGCLATNFIIDRDGNGQMQIDAANSANIERAQETNIAPQQQASPQQQTQPAEAQPKEGGK